MAGGISYNPDRSDAIESSYVSAVVSVGTTQTEAKVGGSPLAGRQELILLNDSDVVIYFGPTGVTTSGVNKGVPINPGEFLNIPFSDHINVFLIADTNSNNMIVQELG